MHTTKNTRNGFTLIEILASFMVLSVILVLLAQVFSGASKSMEVGINSSQQLSNGRAVLSYMARELSMATADDLLTLKATTNEIYFVALSDRVETATTTTNRLPTQVHYYITTKTNGYTRAVLKRSVESSITTIDAYWTNTWWSTHSDASNDPILADNVKSFSIKLYDCGGNTAATYDTNNRPPPMYADLYLELLSEDHARKAELMGAGGDDYRSRMARPFHRRVFLNNYPGFNQRPL